MTRLLHQDIADTLRQSLTVGRWRVGQQLPTERELAESLSCAIGTLRKALSALEDDGMLERIQGAGTFVKRVPEAAEYPLFHLEKIGGGGRPSAQVMGYEIARCPVEIQTPRHIRRRPFLDDQAVAIEDIWISLPRPLGEGEGNNALYRWLTDEFGIWIKRVEDRVSVATNPAMQNLGLPSTQGFVARYSFDARDQWIEYSETHFDPQLALYNARWEQ